MTKLQSRGQVTIPARIRRAFGWKPGDFISFTSKPDGVLELRVLKRRAVHELLEEYSQEGVAPDSEELRQAAADERFREKFRTGDGS